MRGLERCSCSYRPPDFQVHHGRAPPSRMPPCCCESLMAPPPEIAVGRRSAGFTRRASISIDPSAMADADLWGVLIGLLILMF
jgi:hypothetical protein